jgi:hypothetical protein
VILDSLFGIAQDAVIDAKKILRLDDESGLFPSFANCGLADQFPDFQNTARDGPLGLQRRVGPLDQEHTSVLDDDGADTDQRDFGKFAFHVERRNDVDYIGRLRALAKVEYVGYFHLLIARMAR